VSILVRMRSAASRVIAIVNSGSGALIPLNEVEFPGNQRDADAEAKANSAHPFDGIHSLTGRG